MSNEVTDTTPMPWGEHRGKQLGDIPPSYLLWLLEQSWIADFKPLFAYLKQNEKALREEANRAEAKKGAVDSDEMDSYDDYLRHRN